MSATPLSRADRRRTVFVGWVALASVNGVAMLLLPSVQTVAFHIVWISMSVVYGWQGWSTRRTALVLAVVVATTGAAIARAAARGDVDWQELTEVPLMALVFLAMVWHVRRRAAALAETQHLIERERRAHEVKELFVRSCSHEMRTPIAVARGFTELVQVVLPEGASRDDLGIVVDELDKLSSLAGRLLVLADAYESAQFEWAPVDLAALVGHSVQRWRPTAAREWTLEVSAATAEADESRLEAALDALIENAVKFTVDGDVIALRCRATRSGALIEVEDSGVGFARSRRGGSSAAMPTAGRPGTGLGLAIARAIVEGHGGELTLSEDREGGAVAHLELPSERPPGERKPDLEPLVRPRQPSLQDPASHGHDQAIVVGKA